LTIVGRWSRGPTPSRQWYSSAKQPPGQRRFGIGTDTADVRDRRVLADPEPAVDAASEVLGEVPVEMAADPGSGQVEVDNRARGGHKSVLRSMLWAA
jgi:hypothetical protein